MKIKCVSFSNYNLNLSSYKFTKMDLFEFLFTQIILNDNLDKNKLIIDILDDLDIKEDLYYLFNNVYYKLLDNDVIISNKEDIYSLKLKELKLNSIFKDYLLKSLLPIKNTDSNKEYIYDYLNDKIVVSNIKYNDSNIMCLEIDNSLDSLERLTNKFSKALFNDSEGVYLVKDAIINPYYFEIQLDTNNSKLVSKNKNKELIYHSLVNNSLFINNQVIKGEYLTNNIYFKYIFSNNDKINDNSEYVFKYDSNKEGEVFNNIIYVNFNFTKGDFIDLLNKERYFTGINKLENNDSISVFNKEKEDRVSEFKLYLIKNKDKFKCNINKIIEEI